MDSKNQRGARAAPRSSSHTNASQSRPPPLGAPSQGEVATESSRSTRARPTSWSASGNINEEFHATARTAASGGPSRPQPLWFASQQQPAPPVSPKWEDPHTVVIPRGSAGFGFTLRHFVVYPPQSALHDDGDGDVYGEEDQAALRIDGEGVLQYFPGPRGLQRHRYPLDRQASLEPQDTIFVRTVKEGSPAHLSGLRQGDRLVAVNGDSVTGRSYHKIIQDIHDCGSVLKLLVVPKDEDILQMAYHFSTGDSIYSSSTSVSDIGGYQRLKHQHHHYSQGDIDIADSRSAHQHKSPGHSSSGGFPEHHDVRYSFPLSGWETQEIDYRLGSGDSQPLAGEHRFHQSRPSHSGNHRNKAQYTTQEPSYTMTCNIPSKSKFSFGLYFPPKTSAPNVSTGSNGTTSTGSSQTVGADSSTRASEDSSDPRSLPKSETFETKKRLPTGAAVQRKNSLDEASVLSSSAKSRDYFIRYSTDKAASDRQGKRFSPRHLAYERNPSESQPDTYNICRSHTIGSLSPSSKPSGQPSSQTAMQGSSTGPTCHYVPVLSESKLSSSSDSIDSRMGGPSYREQLTTSVGGPSKSFVVRIPYDQQQQQQQGSIIVSESHSALPTVRQSYGTTFALTRSPTATHIEIQKSIGKPIVSQRKYQFEVAGTSAPTQATVSAPSSVAGLNRYKSEIDKIRHQPKFSSIAMRKASFEQSPDRDPPGLEDTEDKSQMENMPVDIHSARIETAQPTIKVRKISSERYKSGARLPGPDIQDRDRPEQGNVPIRIYVTPGNSPHKSSAPLVEIGIDPFKKQTLQTQASGQKHLSQHQHVGNVTTITGSNTSSSTANTLLQTTSCAPPSSSPPLSKGSIYRGPTSSTGSRVSLGGDSTAGLVDSGVWVKSYHSSSSTDMLDDAISGTTSGSIDSSSSSSNNTTAIAISDSGVVSLDVAGAHSLDSCVGDQHDGIARSGASRRPRKTSYLSAVNAPVSRVPLVSSQHQPGPIESHSNLVQTPQQQVAQSKAQTPAFPQSSSLLSAAESQTAPYQDPSHPLQHFHLQETVALAVTTDTLTSTRVLSSSDVPSSSPLSLPSSSSSSHTTAPPPLSGSAASISSMASADVTDSGAGFVPVASVAPTVMSTSDSSVMLGHHGKPSSDGDISVTMRKKLQESLEDQANKLHRRTSYLMATARDRTNTVPIEQAFSPAQVPPDYSLQHPGVPVRHQSSVKLNKFFGENIPSIAEGVEVVKSSDRDELPEIIRKGPLSCKISVIEGKKCSDRSWKPVFAVLRPTELFLTREKDISVSASFEDQHIPLRSVMVEFARDYAKKKKHVFRMSTHNECEYLFQTEDRGTMLCWIQAIKSINEPDQAGKMDEMIASEQERQLQAPPIEINVIPSKMSPQLGHKGGRKLSTLSLKAKLSSSPSMRRKKSGTIEKDESSKKTWMGRIALMKSLKKHSEDSSSITLSEQEGDMDKMQFGVRLEDCFPSPHNQNVPLIVELCTRIVEARGLEVIGVYRVPGNSAAINALTEEFNRGIDAVNIDNEKLLDINVISSLLKSFFRKLEEPLVPTDAYENFIEANRHPDESKRKLKIKRLLHLLPPHHHETFRHMAEHLNKVASYGNINKMDAKNLAIMFGPTLVRKKEDDTVSLVTDMSDQCRIVESIILHHDWFFSTWDQDNYIPMETTVETVNLEDGIVMKDDDEEADSTISTKELISSIVGAASKKLRSQRQASSLDLGDGAGDPSDGDSSALGASPGSFSQTSLNKSGTVLPSSRSASEEYLDKKVPVTLSSAQSSRSDVRVGGGGTGIVVPVAPMMADSKKSKGRTASSSSDPYFGDLQYADATSNESGRTPPSPSLSSSTATGATNMSHYFSDESLLADDHIINDSDDWHDDEMEMHHPGGGRLPTSLSRDAIHDTLKRIGNDVSALLQTFEQKQQKERERRRREQERLEAEHRRARLELEQEDFEDGIDGWLLTPAWRAGSGGSREGGIAPSQHAQPTSTHAGAPRLSRPSHKMPDVVSSSYLGENYPYDYHSDRVTPAFRGSRERLEMDNRRELYSAPSVTSNVPPLPARHTAMTVSPPPQGALVSLPPSQADHRLPPPRNGSPEDYLLSDLHIQEDGSSSKQMVRPLPQHSLKQPDTQLKPRQQFGFGAERASPRPISSLRQGFGRRHGSLDSLIDMIDRDKRASWTSSDSEDGSDLLTSITTTFDQKLQILLNPKYKLTGAGKKMSKTEQATTNDGSLRGVESTRHTDSLTTKSASTGLKQTSYPMAAALLDSDRSFQDPSLHRSAKSDPKIGIASRFQRIESARATSSSPKSGSLLYDSSPSMSQQHKRELPDFRSFLRKPASASHSNQQRDPSTIVLTQPRKLESAGKGSNRVVRRNSGKSGKSDSSRAVSKSEKTDRKWSLQARSGQAAGVDVYYLGGGSSQGEASDLDAGERGDKENLETPAQLRSRKSQHRRHTVGGAEDLEHISALSHINDNRIVGARSAGLDGGLGQQQQPSAWEQLRPAVKDSGPGSMQAWIQRERLRGSTPDLSCKQEKNG